MARDWVAWHDPYDDPASPLALRLAIVQAHLATALDDCRPGGIRLLSACAGQGRDVIGVLPVHSRCDDVHAVLVELDPDNCTVARAAVAAAGLAARVDVREADAGDTAAYAGAVPADVLLFCGVFGNVSDADVRRTIDALPTLCADGATVLWTRHRKPPDLTPAIREWFAAAGFTEVAFHAPDDVYVSVGVHRLAAPPQPYEPGVRMFTFAE